MITANKLSNQPNGVSANGTLIYSSKKKKRNETGILLTWNKWISNEHNKDYEVDAVAIFHKFRMEKNKFYLEILNYTNFESVFRTFLSFAYIKWVIWTSSFFVSNKNEHHNLIS